MSNLVDSLKADTAAEIARVENYLKVLKNLQSVVASPGKKRKYTKRKTTAKKKPGRPKKVVTIVPIEGYITPETVKVSEYTTNLPNIEPKFVKKKPGRPRKKAA